MQTQPSCGLVANPDAWTAFLKRQRKTMLTRAGQGHTPSFKLFQRQRWIRECVEDTGVSLEVSELFNADIEDELARTYDPLCPVQAVKSVYAYFLNRFQQQSHIAGGLGDQLLYKLFDAAGTVLYVGITNRGPQRLVEHHRTKPWFGDVATVLFERFSTREQVEERERLLIKEMRPLFNVQHNSHR